VLRETTSRLAESSGDYMEIFIFKLSKKSPPPPPRILNFGQGSVVDTLGVP